MPLLMAEEGMGGSRASAGVGEQPEFIPCAVPALLVSASVIDHL